MVEGLVAKRDLSNRCLLPEKTVRVYMTWTSHAYEIYRCRVEGSHSQLPAVAHITGNRLHEYKQCAVFAADGTNRQQALVLTRQALTLHLFPLTPNILHPVGY